jgi:hypothetical protein
VVLSAAQLWSVDADGEALFLLLLLPRQPSWEDVVPTLIERLAAAAAPSDRLFPHDDPRVGGLFKTAGGPAYQEGLPGALAELLAPRCACLSAPHDGCADWCIAAHRRAGGSAERAANESNGLLVVGDFLPPADVA